MKLLRVGVKFCGNCNPHLDCPKLLEKLIQKAKDVHFVYWFQTSFDVLLILSGCPVDCASRPDFNGPTVVVSGKMVDRVPVPENLLLDHILGAFERLKEG